VPLLAHCVDVLMTPAATARFLERQKSTMDAPERALAASIMRVHRARLLAVEAGRERTQAAKRFLKPLRGRRATRAAIGELVVAPSPDGTGPATFHAWLSREPRKDRHRDISKSKRILRGLSGWPLGWLTTAGVVCYERAVGRARAEKGGAVTEAYARGLVHTTFLPTAVASPSDHYVLVQPGARPRFLTVQEVARSLGVPEGGSLGAMLRGPALTPTQAIECLGGGIHVGVAHQLVKALRARGLLAPGLTYGSAYSGIDMFAAAVEAEFGDAWTYEFASECDNHARAGLSSLGSPEQSGPRMGKALSRADWGTQWS
jgi:hypothetical protein